MRIALLTLVLLLSGSSAVSAQTALTIEVSPENGATAGDAHVITGSLAAGGPARPVTLEAKPAGEDAYTVVSTTSTEIMGNYRFAQRFDRNTELRVSAEGAVAEAIAYVFPDPKLTVRTERGRTVRLTQSFRAEDADVRARTRFYLGRRGAKRGRYVAQARIRRVAAGRFRVSVLARVPKAYGGRFSFGACIEARPGSELGKPGLRCPKRVLRY